MRSVREVLRYQIQARDGEIGHVEDFIAEDPLWGIRYMVVDTRNWLPGKKVLIAPPWIERVEWAQSSVYVDLLQEQIRNSPEYHPHDLVNRECEVKLYDYYGRPPYWRWLLRPDVPLHGPHQTRNGVEVTVAREVPTEWSGRSWRDGRGSTANFAASPHRIS